MKKPFFIAFFLITLFFLPAGLVQAQTQKEAEINFFYSETCPHCAKEKEFLKQLEEKYPTIEVKQYEVISSLENQKILQDFYKKYNVPENEQGWVPVTFTPTKYFIGFNDETGKEIDNCLKECFGGEKIDSDKRKVPIFGTVDFSKMSLISITFLLGILDGFNPCAMWILVILISLLLSLRSRKKIALVGGTFILAEGLLYFLFMTAWLNAFLMMKYVSITRILIGVFGIAFGVLRIRDFIKWKPGVCKVVGNSKSQEKIVERMKRVLESKTVPAIILGVVVLAFGVNLIEFFCSAGFPVIYTRILALQDISQLQYYLYLVLYNFLYMLDDFLVFGLAFITLNRFSFSDKYNKYSTLVAGILILILGALLILKPDLLMFA